MSGQGSSIDFRGIFGAFSGRSKATPQAPDTLTETFRNRVLMLFTDSFRATTDHGFQFWEEIHAKMKYLVGRPYLKTAGQTPINDLIAFLLTCEETYFFDFLEYAFGSQLMFWIPNPSKMVADVNLFLLEDDLPYVVTDFVHVIAKERTIPGGVHREVKKIVALPQVIRKDSEVAHNLAIAPALSLLTDVRFSSANNEFLEALQDILAGR